MIPNGCVGKRLLRLEILTDLKFSSKKAYIIASFSNRCIPTRFKLFPLKELSMVCNGKLNPNGKKVFKRFLKV